MGLNPKWWATDGSGEFEDNSDGDITADSLRRFAQEISEDSPDEWIQLVPGPLEFPSTAPWYTADTQILVWMPALVSGVGGGSGSATDQWAYSVDTYVPDLFDTAVFSWTGGAIDSLVLANLEITNTNFKISGVTPDTTITPVIIHDSAPNISAVLAGSRNNATALLGLFGPSCKITSDETPLSIAGRHSFPLETGSAVLVGMLFSPPTGLSVADGVVPPTIDPVTPSPFTVLISSRPTQAWVPITA